MTSDEIRVIKTALQEKADSFERSFGKLGWDCIERRATDAIETLLTREAEVLKDLKNRHTLSRDDNVNVALWNALDAARAILKPQPAALAEEKTNG